MMLKKCMLSIFLFGFGSAQDTLLVDFHAAPRLDRPRIGLALSGGGALGFAHIGILKMLDSLRIPIDYIAGTSMGGIIGALYSIGYNGEAIETIVTGTDWEDVFSDAPSRDLLPYLEKMETGRYQVQTGMTGFRPTVPSGMIFGQKIYLLFSSFTFPYEKIRNFDELPIPFRCVSADLITGNEVVLQHGSLSKAMRATMAIPTVFSPIGWGDSLLVDGGMVNNLPIDIVRNMGADFVIAVDVLGHTVQKEYLDNALAIMQRSLHLLGIEKWKRNVEMADIYVAPNLNEYTLGDFSHDKVREIIRAGEQAADEAAKPLADFNRKHQMRIIRNTMDPAILGTPCILDDVQIIGGATTPFEIVYDSLRLDIGNRFDHKAFVQRLSLLKASGLFRKIRYECIPVSNHAIRLVLYIEPAQQPVIFSLAVQGNENLPFSTIFSTLRIGPGDTLNIQKLSTQIMELYGLGYFESIHYEVIPLRDNFVRLELHVNEHPLRKFRVGVRYDDKSKLVIALGVKMNSLFIPGLYFRNELQLSGLKRFENKLYYPMYANNSQVYPYLRHLYKDIPTYIHDERGTRIASYRNNSSMTALGFGRIYGRHVRVEAEFRSEKLFVKPDIAFPAAGYFPSWDDRLFAWALHLHVDKLNDAMMPSRGMRIDVMFEQVPKLFKLNESYWLIQAMGEIYAPLQHPHLFHFQMFGGFAGHETPVFKYIHASGPDLFVGMDHDQLVGRRVNFFRINYFYLISNQLRIRFTANLAWDIRYGDDVHLRRTEYVTGWGAGVCMKTAIGVFEFIRLKGSQGMAVPDKMVERLHFRFGYKF